HGMNQRGHGLPNMSGVKEGDHDERAGKLVPGYRTMGQTGQGDMATMGRPVPKNSIPMMGAKGNHDVITMGGMATVLKVRDHLKGYQDPGWYEIPAGTQAGEADAADLKRDGIDVEHPPAAVEG